MRGSRTFIGVVLFIGGVAALGCFLTAAGGHATASAVVLGALAVVMFIGGFVLIRTSGRDRSANPTPEKRRVYRRLYQGPHSSAH